MGFVLRNDNTFLIQQRLQSNFLIKNHESYIEHPPLSAESAGYFLI